MNDDRQPELLVPGGMLLGHAVAWIIWLLELLLVVPAYAKTFQDFRLKLPALTEGVLALSRAVTAYLVVAVLGLMILLAIDGAILFWVRSRTSPGISWLFFVLGLLVPVLGVIVTCLGVWTANQQLWEGFNKQ